MADIYFASTADRPSDLEVGDCLLRDPMDDALHDVEIVDCSETHEAEVYASATMDDGEYPGQRKVEEMVRDICVEEFAWFIHIAPSESELDYFAFHPTETMWNLFDYRQITCIAVDPEGTTGSLVGANR
ncbi:hypothetical protein GCM10009799_12460 [Nocardiopsis rhodophaea]|uniref:Septum formation-related domain-containing protein n=1 Tax=Nocardiopsis rhodophaea TaxID=280238 RepID=A0ABP5DXX7_9ACTN